jgi:hypothetical protein
MITVHRRVAAVIAAVCFVCLVVMLPRLRAQEAPGAPAGAKTWLGKQHEIEEYLKTAEIVKMDEIGVGVTKPRHAYLAPGGPISEMAWKVLPADGFKGGYHESYKSEIAGYEMDKLLELNMVPPKVERRVNGTVGVAVMWAVNTKSFKDLGGAPAAPPRYLDAWNRQMIRAKMFHDLIGETDPNLGNWLVGPEWTLILIDNSRAFSTDKNLVHELTRVQRDLWDRMKALTSEQVTAAVGGLIDAKQIRAIFERRDQMQKVVDNLLKKNKSEALVIVQ